MATARTWNSCEPTRALVVPKTTVYWDASSKASRTRRYKGKRVPLTRPIIIVPLRA